MYFFTATHVLDEVSIVCCYLINVLKIVNISRRPLPMTAVSSFVNLKVLYISPHNINDELVESFGKLKWCILFYHQELYRGKYNTPILSLVFYLGCMQRLRNVHIATNAYTDCPATPVDYR